MNLIFLSGQHSQQVSEISLYYAHFTDFNCKPPGIHGLLIHYIKYTFVERRLRKSPLCRFLIPRMGSWAQVKSEVLILIWILLTSLREDGVVPV